MNLSNEPHPIIDITNSSDGDQDVRLEDFMTAEELQAAVHHSLLPLHTENPQLPDFRVRSPDVTPYDNCLQKVLEVFPDVSHDHVKSLYNSQPPNALSPDGIPVSQELISLILDGGKYPTERDRQNELKRKRDELPDSDGERAAKWASIDNITRPAYEYEAVDALVEDFPDIPRRFIDLKFREIGNLYALYLALDIADDTYDTSEPRPYTRLKKARKAKDSKHGRLATHSSMSPTGYGPTELQNELDAARAQRKKLQMQRQIKRDASAAEAAEEKELRDNKQVLECGSCFDEIPINKIAFCNADDPHSACFECATTWVKTKIGESRYHIPCIVGADCEATYSRHERERFLDARVIEKLERLEQQTCLREANLSNLEECPFCDFAAECPPVEVDKEFRCGNTECQRVSCRKCKVATHIPMSCEEFKKENGLTERHQIEEARTQALIRQCPQCKTTIMKDSGCNKMTCSCGACICDYCGKDITKEMYGHFRDGPTAVRIPGLRGKCPTHDDDYTRNQQNMDKAEKDAQEKIRKENPDISEEDLKIKMKESVRSPVRRAREVHYMPPPVAGPAMPVVRAEQEARARRYAAQYAALDGGIPPGYAHPNLGALNRGPPVGVFAPPQYAAPQDAPDLDDRRRRHAREGLHMGMPRPRNDAVGNPRDRIQGAQMGAHQMYHGLAAGQGAMRRNLNHALGDFDEGMDDFMAENWANMLEAEMEAAAAFPRRILH